MMDENKDDSITFDEFKRGIAMAGMRPVPTEAEFRALFRSFDANANNVISHQEMIAALEKDATRKAKKEPTAPREPKGSESRRGSLRSNRSGK